MQASKNNLPASRLPVHAAASRKQQNNESTCLRKPGKQTTNLRGLFRGKKQNKTKTKTKNNQPTTTTINPTTTVTTNNDNGRGRQQGRGRQ